MQRADPIINLAKLMQGVALFLILFPSLGLIQKYTPLLTEIFTIEQLSSDCLSLILLLLFSVIGGLLLRKIKQSLQRRQQLAMDDKKIAIIGLSVTLIALATLFYFLYPLASSGVFGGGSDRDEALNIAVTALLNGHYPYYEVTYVPGIPHEMELDGSPISPMPGELFLAIPFVMLGNGAYQLFFWIPAAAVSIYLMSGSYLLAFVATLVLCVLPASLNEIISGGDLSVNGIWLFCCFLQFQWLTREHRWQLFATAIFLGIALSTRLNFLLVAPFVAGFCWQRFGWQTALKISLIALTSFLVVTLPFVIYDFDSFSPLHTYSKLGRFDELVPKIGIIVPLLAGFIALMLAKHLYQKPLEYWLIGVALSLSIPIISATVLQSFANGRVELVEYSWYGLSWLYFAAIGYFTMQDKTVP